MFRKFLMSLVCASIVLSACSPAATTPSASPTAEAPTAMPATAMPPTDVPPTAAPAGSEIQFLISASPEEQAAFDKLVGAFKAKHPDVTVYMLNIPGEQAYAQRVASDLIAGTPADIILFDYEQMAQFFAKDAFMSLDDYLAKSTLIKADDFYPQAMSPFQWKGHQMCIPLNISNDVTYYNKDLFTAAGLDFPADGWTWDDFLADAKALTKDDGTQFGGAMSAELGQLAPFIWQNDGKLVDDEDKPTTLALDDPDTMEALEWAFNLQLTEHVIPNEQQERSEDSRSRFLAGEMGTFFSSRKLVATMRVTAKFDWDVAPLPMGKEAASVLHSDGYCISAGSKNADAAWSFVEFANSVEGQTLLASTGRTVPSLKSVAESPAFLSTDKPEHAQVWLDQIAVLHALPIISTWGEIEERASEELERGFYGDVDIEEAIKDAISHSAPEFKDGVTP